MEDDGSFGILSGGDGTARSGFGDVGRRQILSSVHEPSDSFVSRQHEYGPATYTNHIDSNSNTQYFFFF